MQTFHKAPSTKLLLWCGVASSVIYVAMNVVVPFGFEGYSCSSQTVSELSAVGAPTRNLWVVLAMFYNLSFAFFGWGVLRAAGANKRLKCVGWIIFLYCALNFYWPPMHLRGTPSTLTYTLHLVWASATVVLMMSMMGVGAAALGVGFRYYTIGTIALLIVFGIMTSVQAPRVPLGLPTPLLGIWERILIAFFLLWIVFFALRILKRH